MFKFAGVSGYDQLEISQQSLTGGGGGGGDCNGNNKWAKQKREVFHSSSPGDIPKIQVTRRHVYAVHGNSVVILDTKPLMDPSCADILSVERKEYQIDNHTSQITCFAVEEDSLLLCSCSDENVLLSKWDSMLGHWDTKAVSEGDKRILSCSVTFKGLAIYISLFKWDILIVYKIVSAHPPTEPGPLIITNMEVLCTLEKVKEMTTWSKCLFFNENFNIIGVASGNTVAVKVWEVLPEKDKFSYTIKLKSHRMVNYLKTIAAADVTVEKDCVLLLVVGSDGGSEVFSLTKDNFILLYRFKVEDPGGGGSGRGDVGDSLNQSMTNSLSAMHVESRVLCSNFFPVKFPSQTGGPPQPPLEIGGDGDAKLDYKEFDKLSDKDKREFVGDMEDNVEDGGKPMCPKLIVAATTTKGVLLVDVISGQCEMVVTHSELLHDENIFIQNAQMSVNPESREIILGLQSCLTRYVFSRRFVVSFAPKKVESLKEVDEDPGPESPQQRELSLIPREALSAKSVLRKRIKSPPRQSPKYPQKSSTKPIGIFRTSGGNSVPAWARSRSRPSLKSSSSHSGSKTNLHNIPPNSARSHSSMSSKGSSKHQAWSIGSEISEGIVNVPGTGSYENDDLPFHQSRKIVLPSTTTNGISVLRIAQTTSGKHLAFGGNLSPLIITKTRPFQSYRLFKDIGKVSGLHFNFNGDLLVVASSDCRTTLVEWHNYKELLSFEFSSKFNEHVHAQFYFMDKFIVQPEENKLVLYSYAKRDTGYIKLKAGEYQLECQTITALAAANQFYSNMIITGLSNKSLQIFDTNAESVCATIPNTHVKPISCIRLNEAPKGPEYATQLCDIFLTSSFSYMDPIKLWDMRTSKCIMRVSDVCQPVFVPTARPSLSPCGRYICTGFEDNSLTFYDVRKIKHRLSTIKKVGSTILDCCFDSKLPMVWSGCRNGSIYNFYLP